MQLSIDRPCKYSSILYHFRVIWRWIRETTAHWASKCNGDIFSECRHSKDVVHCSACSLLPPYPWTAVPDFSWSGCTIIAK